MEKKPKTDAEERPVLRLRRRPLVVLSDNSLGDVAGGHTCGASCHGTCPPGNTCEGKTCGQTCDPQVTFCWVCPSRDCATYPEHNCSEGCP